MPQDRGSFIQELLKVGIPAGAAIAGSVNPNLLPGAAGLATGFAGQIEKQREEKQREIDQIELIKKKAKIEQELQDRNAEDRLNKLPELLKTLGITMPGVGEQGQITGEVPQMPSPQPQIAQQSIYRTEPTPEEIEAQQSLVPQEDFTQQSPQQLPQQVQDIISRQPPPPEQPALFATKPSLSFDPATGKMSVSISKVENPQIKINREIRLAQENERRDFRNDFASLTNFGGTIGDTAIKRMEDSLGFEVGDQLVAGRGEPMVDNQGNRKWRVLSNKEWDTKVTTGKFAPTEIEYLQKIKAEHTAWTNVLSRLDKIGISPETLNSAGSVNFEDVKTPIGILSLPARFNLIGQLTKDPKYTAIKRDIEIAFQAFRIRVTGAQASDKELKTLRPLLAGMKDRPEVFFATIGNQMENAEIAFKDRMDIYERAGRDISRFEDFFQTGEVKTESQSERRKALEAEARRRGLL